MSSESKPTTPPQTRSTTGGQPSPFMHVVRDVLKFARDTPMDLAFAEAGVEEIPDLLSLTPSQLSQLTYPESTTDAKGNDKVVTKSPPLGFINRVTIFQQFVGWWRTTNPDKPLVTQGNHDGYYQLTYADFASYRSSPESLFLVSTGRSPSTAAPASVARSASVASASSSGYKRDPVIDFQRSIKRDPSLFETLKHDHQWDGWQRHTSSLAHTFDVADVLDPTYQPSTPEETELFNLKQDFMFAVFNNILKTDTGKNLVRQHEKTRNAQAVYKALSDYALRSARASMDASNLLTYITTARLGDGKWKGGTEAFILNWVDQVRKYHEVVKAGSHFSDEQQLTMLQNSVMDIEELCAVQTTAEQLQSQVGKSLTFSSYLSLLKSTAARLDEKSGKTPRRGDRRQVFQHFTSAHGEPPGEDVFYDADPSLLDHDPGPHFGFNIDSNVNLIQAHVREQTLAPQQQMTPRWPRLDDPTWQHLSSSDRRLWTQLSFNGKNAILAQRHPPDPGSQHTAAPAATSSDGKPPSQKPSFPKAATKVNLHDVSLGELSEFIESLQSEDNSSPSLQDWPSLQGTDVSSESLKSRPFLAHLVKQEKLQQQKQLPPHDIRRIMSSSLSKQGKEAAKALKEVTLDGTKYREVNNHIIFHSSGPQRFHSGAFVDRGTNGSVAGKDVRVINFSDGTVNVAIDDHQLVGVPLASVGGIVQTQHGPVLAIINQAAHTGQGKTVLSCVQMEAFQQLVEDGAIKVGGKQQIQTLDGFVLPLNIRDGLAHLSIRPFTDAEWNDPSIPRVVLTSAEEWDPSVLDSCFDENPEWLEDHLDKPGGIPLLGWVSNYVKTFFSSVFSLWGDKLKVEN